MLPGGSKSKHMYGYELGSDREEPGSAFPCASLSRIASITSPRLRPGSKLESTSRPTTRRYNAIRRSGFFFQSARNSTARRSRQSAAIPCAPHDVGSPRPREHTGLWSPWVWQSARTAETCAESFLQGISGATTITEQLAFPYWRRSVNESGIACSPSKSRHSPGAVVIGSRGFSCAQVL
jgi:hypothetical protein